MSVMSAARKQIVRRTNKRPQRQNVVHRLVVLRINLYEAEVAESHAAEKKGMIDIMYAY